MFRKKVMKEVDVPETIEVLNYTEFKSATNIVKALTKILGFETIRIRLYYLPKVFKLSSTDFWAVAKKAADREQSYKIFLSKKLGPYSLKKVLAHEFIHIVQYESGDLQVDGELFIWKGVGGNMRKIKYDNRPFEIDAKKRQKVVLRDLKKILYK
jgi:predicted metallopeptidase